MSINHPLITIQCGNYSNYIGAHYWNLQEAGFTYAQGSTRNSEQFLEVDNDVLYREGQTSRGESTYTPRLISLDLHGSLGLLSQAGDLYGKDPIPSNDSVTWPAGCQVFKEEPHKKNDFLRELEEETENETNEKDIDLSEDTRRPDKPGDCDVYNLDGQVTYWSDFMRSRFHPKSVLLVSSFQHENIAHPFDMWGLGTTAWTGCDGVGEEVEDRIRHFAEECDFFGGIQLMADWHDGFGGLANHIVNLLGDEYPGKPVLTFPCAPSSYPSYSLEAGWARLTGATLTLSSFLSTSLVTPLSLARDWFPLANRSITLPNCPYKASLPYHSSAVLSLALDTATLPYRQRNPNQSSFLTPSQLCSGLATQGRKIAVISTDLPVSLDVTKASDYIESDLLSKAIPLLPGGAIVPAPAVSHDPYCALLTLRGIKSTSLFKKRSASFTQCGSAAAYIASCVNGCRRDCRPVGTYLFNKPVPTSKPFPHIFSKHVDIFGAVGNQERISEDGVKFSSILTSWEAGPTARGAVASLAKSASKIQLNKIHRLSESGVETEDWEEAVENMSQLSECYIGEDDY